MPTRYSSWPNANSRMMIALAHGVSPVASTSPAEVGGHPLDRRRGIWGVATCTPVSPRRAERAHEHRQTDRRDQPVAHELDAPGVAQNGEAAPAEGEGHHRHDRDGRHGLEQEP